MKRRTGTKQEAARYSPSRFRREVARGVEPATGQVSNANADPAGELPSGLPASSTTDLIQMNKADRTDHGRASRAMVRQGGRSRKSGMYR